jgi:hypothetical protein
MKARIVEAIRNERGAVLIVSLFLMVVIALIGLAAILTTSADIKSSRLDRLDKSAFYAADAGVEVVPNVVDYYVDNMPDSTNYPSNLSTELQPLMKDQYFLNEIMGYSNNNDKDTDSTDASPDVEMTLQGRDVDLDIDRFHTQHSDGAAAESLLGYEGVGSGLGGGAISIYYRSDAKGHEIEDTTKSVEVVYRYVY